MIVRKVLIQLMLKSIVHNVDLRGAEQSVPHLEEVIKCH